MTGSRLAAAPGRERYAILCPAHAVVALVAAGERMCPHGGHRLARWWVYDGHTKRVVAEASEERGQEIQIDRPLSEVPRLGLADVSMSERELKREKAMPRKIKGSGPASTQSAAPKKRAILAERFEATDGGEFLRLALVAHKGGNGLTYRVMWEVRFRGTSGVSERGTTHVTPTELAGREAFDSEAEKLRKAGLWRPTTQGSARLVLKPVPAPRLKAAAAVPGKGRRKSAA